jgi:hypothetical protein
MRPTLATLALVLAAKGAAAQDPSLSGDPITTDRLLATQEMIRVADAIDAAVDAKDWAEARSHFTDTITVDFTSLAGGEPATIPAQGLIDGWSTNLTAEKPSFHLRGNHRVTFLDEDSAVMRSHGYAWNRLERGAEPANGGDPMWEVWGEYVHGFTLTDAGWKVDAMSLAVSAQRGNDFVRDTPGS